MSAAIVVFAKAPEPGRVKTRLAAGVGAVEAARIYERMVAMLLERLLGGGLAASLELHTDVDTDAWGWAGVTRRLQGEGDLGARMLHALREGLGRGHGRVLIVGGDVPTVPLPYLEELLGAEADVALGPAEDGGYYAISCRRVAEGMFDGVAWSTAAAREGTRGACERAGLTVWEGRTWFDIDEPSDLERI